MLQEKHNVRYRGGIYDFRKQDGVWTYRIRHNPDAPKEPPQTEWKPLPQEWYANPVYWKMKLDFDTPQEWPSESPRIQATKLGR